MTTRADIVAVVADILARSDLGTQIGREVERAVEHYNRIGAFPFQEARDGTITTVDGTEWYSEVDFSGGAGSIALGTVAVSDILDITYARVTQGSTSWPLAVIKYADHETMAENVAPEGVPDTLVRYAHQIGFWPTPNGAYTVSIGARFKEAIPTGDTDTSIWFTFAREMIELRAAWRVTLSYIQDMERAMGFSAMLREAEGALSVESARQTGTRRLKPTRF